MTHIEKLVPDTSVIIEGQVSEKISSNEISIGQLLVHEAVVAELEHQANLGKDVGFLGINELTKLQILSKERKFELKFTGRKPSAMEIRNADFGEIDSMIRDLAFEEGAVLFTADKVQAKIAKAKDIEVLFIDIQKRDRKILLEGFFDERTMSVHLRENMNPSAKKGVPGNWAFEVIRDKPLTRDEIQEISREIVEEASIRQDGFIEIERKGSTIVQLGKYRIVITRPPFSDGWEITAVRPVKKLNLEDYKLKDILMDRISKQAEGILIAGAPGMGKSTFAQALAEYFAGQKKVVKTVEAPRDLILPETITQYSISHGSSQEIHDVLLLSRPDYTIFDEMRNTDDFKLFADLRLSGVGMVGVVHATNPIDAIQRFVGRIELGVIPQVIDTVIFIKNGAVGKVLSLHMTVKVPDGMTEADLARPVVVVNDFETKKAEYELYSYGEETVVVPAVSQKSTPAKSLAAERIVEEFRNYASDVKVEVVSDHKCIVYVPESAIAKIIGKQGSNINAMEKNLGISIDVQELKASGSGGGESIQYSSKINKGNIIFSFSENDIDKNVNIYVDNDFLLSAKIGHNASIKIKKGNKIGRIIMTALNSGGEVKILS